MPYRTELPQHINTPAQLHMGSLKPIGSTVYWAPRGYVTTTRVSGVLAQISKNPTRTSP